MNEIRVYLRSTEDDHGVFLGTFNSDGIEAIVKSIVRYGVFSRFNDFDTEVYLESRYVISKAGYFEILVSPE